VLGVVLLLLRVMLLVRLLLLLQAVVLENQVLELLLLLDLYFAARAQTPQRKGCYSWLGHNSAYRPLHLHAAAAAGVLKSSRNDAPAVKSACCL
jgi:hypothetical protein